MRQKSKIIFHKFRYAIQFYLFIFLYDFKIDTYFTVKDDFVDISHAENAFKIHTKWIFLQCVMHEATSKVNSKVPYVLEVEWHESVNK